MAGVGVVVLTNPGPTADVIGVSLALLAEAACQSLDLHERSGIGLIVLSDVLLSARGLAPTAEPVAPTGKPEARA